MDNPIINLVEEDDEEYPAIARLIEVGRQKKYVTIDDILQFFPEAETDVEQLEETFAALMSAGIPYIEDEAVHDEPSDDDLTVAEETEEPRVLLTDDLENIDTDDPIGLYLKEVSRVPLLNAEEEVELAQRIERGRMAREELARGNVNAHRRMQLRKLIEDGWSAREHLITANSRLVISVAKKYMGRGVPFLDLIQEGNIGLIRATKKFDYRRGHKFSTYATWWIRQSISRYIAEHARTIRIPVHLFEAITRLLRIQRSLVQVLGREPTQEELALESDLLSPEDAAAIKRAREINQPIDGELQKRWTWATVKVQRILQSAEEPISLERPVGDEESSQLGDFIEDDEALEPMDAAAREMLREQVQNALAALSERERQVLELRFGLIDGKDHTLEEVSRYFNVTRERIRQIEAKALRKLRHPTRSRHLREYLG